MRTRQQSFQDLKRMAEHGGVLGLGRAKTRRPLSTRKAMFFTFRSSLAVGAWSFHRPENLRFIQNTLLLLSQRFGIRIYEQSINGNHVHLLLRGYDRRGIQNFLRSLAAQIATFITKARKGKALGKKFWDFLVHSLIVEWRRAFFAVKKYIIQNDLETWGFIPYTPRKRKPILS